MILPHPIPAGHYDRRVTVYRRGVTTNEIGETVPTESLAETRWAKVETVSMEEQLNAAEQVGRVTHKITLRYTPELSHVDAIHYRGRRFAIKSLVNKDEADREIEMLCVGGE